MRTTSWCHWYNVQVFDALVTHCWQVRSHRPVCHQHTDDDWHDDCQKLMWRHLCMKWRALGPTRSLAGRCRWLVSVLISHRLHRRSGSGHASRMKTNPLQTLEHRNADHMPMTYRLTYNVDCVIFTARHYASSVYAVVMCPSVRLSVRLSVTSRRSTETDKRRITQSRSHDSPGTLVFWRKTPRQNSDGVTHNPPTKGGVC